VIVESFIILVSDDCDVVSHGDAKVIDIKMAD